MIVKLRQRLKDRSDLTPKRRYAVLGIEADDYRILSDEGRPYLYPSELFVLIDAQVPPDWVVEVGDAGERYAYPREFSKSGFFEAFFEGDRKARAKFWRFINENMQISMSG